MIAPRAECSWCERRAVGMVSGHPACAYHIETETLPTTYRAGLPPLTRPVSHHGGVAYAPPGAAIGKGAWRLYGAPLWTSIPTRLDVVRNSPAPRARRSDLAR